MSIGDKRPRALSSDEGMSQINKRRPAPESSDSRRSGNCVELSFNTSDTSGKATVQNAGGNIFNGDYTVYQNAPTDELNHRITLDTNARMKQAQHGLDQRDVRQWIFSADWDTSSNFNAAQEERLVGTGSWFLGGTEVSTWKVHPGSVLWLEGGPGSGKTVLSSSAVKEIIDFCNLKPSVRGYAYFFFDARNEKLQDLTHENFTRSLISQLSDRCGDQIPTALVSLYNTCDKGHRRPDKTSLAGTLLRVLECFEDVYIIIDALDECAAKDDILKWIQSVTSKTSSNLHLLVTSRAEWVIEKHLAHVSRLRKVSIGDRSSESDIRAYINAKLARTDKWKKPGDKDMIEAALLRNSGSFRFVALQMNDVLECRNKTQLTKQLSSLPRDLNVIYDSIFERSDNPEELQKFLQWLAFSKRDMTRAEIDEVGTVDLGGSDGPLFDLDRRSEEPGAVLTIGYGLVTEIDGIVKLAHLSVKEYLVKRLRSTAETQHCTSEQLSHSVIAQTCLAHLLYFNRESILDGETGYISKNHVSSFPLAEYAAEHFVSHFHSADTDCPRLLELLRKLFTAPRSRAMINWVRLKNPDFGSSSWQSVNDIASPLYYACIIGSTHIVAHLINKGADSNAVGGRMHTPLVAASWQGHGKLAKLLLDSGADVNAAGGEYGTALIATIYVGGHIKLVKLLLDAGADVNVAGGRYGTALQMVSERGHVELAKLLLDAGADVNRVGSLHHTALFAASAEGHIELVKLLLDAGADINFAGGRYGTALQAASEGGHIELAKLLLNAGADVTAAGSHYGTALQAASAKGHIELVKLLVDAGANFNIARGDCGVALQAASEGGHIELAKLLLNAGADVNIAGGEYGTALIAASRAGHVELAKMLLDAGADINFAGGRYGTAVTALQAASARGHVELAKLLLNAGADVTAAGSHCGTALIAASKGGHVELAGLLLDATAGVNVEIRSHGRALQAASEGGHTELVRLLLDNGADVNAAGGVYVTALIAASAGGHVEPAKLLLDAGADVNAAGGHYGTALITAYRSRHREVIKLLRERGAVL